MNEKVGITLTRLLNITEPKDHVNNKVDRASHQTEAGNNEGRTVC